MDEKQFFKVHGRFVWPANPGKHIPGSFTFSFLLDTDGVWCAAVDWLPAGAIAGADARKDLADLSEVEIAKVRKGDAFRLLLRRATTANALEIDGARIFEQYDGDGGLDLRWLLADEFDYGNARLASRIYLGHPPQPAGHAHSASFAFRLALPSPSPQGKVNGKPVHVFPFRARYDARRTEIAPGPLAVDELAAGIEGTPSGCDWIDQRSNTARLASSVLGQFGFTRRGGKATYARFPRNGEHSKEEKSAALWLDDPVLYLRTTLDKFADGHKDLEDCINLSSQNEIPEDEKSDSVLPTGNGQVGTVYFRSSFGYPTFAPAQAVPFGDLRVFRQDNQWLLHFASPLVPNPAMDAILEAPKREQEVEIGASEGKVYWNRLDQVTSSEISDGEIERCYSPDAEFGGTVEVTLPLPAREDSADGSGKLEEPPKTDYRLHNFSIAKLLGIALRSLRIPRLGLGSVLGGEQAHALPDAKVSVLEGELFALAGTAPFVSRSGMPIKWEGKRTNNRHWKKFEFGLQAYNYQENRNLETRPANFGQISFTLPGIDIAEPGAQAKFTGQLEHDPGCPPGASGFRITAAPGAEGSTFSGRLGGLQFGLENARLASHESGVWRFSLALLTEKPVAGAAGSNWTAFDSEFEVTLVLDRVEPIGVDRPWGQREESDPPLLLPMPRRDRQSAETAEPFHLVLHERLAQDSDRQLTALIRDRDSAEASRRSYVVLSRHPFSLSALTMQPLEARGNEADSAAATYDSDTRQWVFSLADTTYHYRLPPQGVGESMDRPGRLEIMDAWRDDEVDPHAVPAGGGLPGQRAADLARRVVDYRLTSPAHLWIRPSDLDRNFMLPEWAAYDLFRQRGDFGIGSRLAGLRAEFLYGLAASVDPALEKGSARAARVAEIEALLGSVPAPDTGRKEPSAAAQRWNALREVIAKRPERLEVWMPDESGDPVFRPARFTDGARFALRDHAQLRSPFPATDSETGDLAEVRGLLAEGEGTDVAAQLAKKITRHGVAGGAIWGIEARSFVRRFLDNPDSTGGSIERIALSPNGGDADLRAEFLGGLLAIIAEVRGGRVQRQRVEILGRIGVFWHRAKHVVIYERTVNPSPQFTPLGGIGQRSRRPVIRKVEEFIELLEPERGYPDTALAEKAAPGILKAVCFNSRRIHVDSAWSEDVGKFGWQIPLWDRLAATQRPSVYPQPDIAFVVHSEGEEDAPSTATECLDPENLYFYSDADARTSDTDLWAPVLAVDWTDLPAPTHAQQQPLDQRASAEHQRKPSATRIPRGQRRFTWRLAPSDRRAWLNHGRGGKPIYARLDTLTFSRATADAEGEHARAVQAAMKGAGEALTADRFDPVAAEMETFLRLAETGDEAGLSESAARMQTKLAEAAFGDLLESDELKPFRDLAELAKAGPDQCRKMVQDLAGSIERKRLTLMANLREWEAGAEAFVKANETISTRDEWIANAMKEIEIAITPSLDAAQADIGKARSKVEQARAAVRDMADDARALVARAQRELEEAHQTYEDHKPWSPARIQDYQNQLESARAGLLADLESALADARQRLATEVGGVAGKVAVEAAAALDDIARAEGGLLAGVGKAESAAQAALAHARELSADKLRLAIAQLDKLRVLAREKEPGNAELQNLLKVARDALVTANSELPGRFDALQKEVARGRRDLSSLIGDGSKLFTGLVANAEKAVADALAQTDKAIVAATDDAIQEAAIESKNAQLALSDGLTTALTKIGEWAQTHENYFDRLKTKLEDALGNIDKLVIDTDQAIGTAADTINEAMADLQKLVSRESVIGQIREQIVLPAFDLIVPADDFDRWKAAHGEAVADIRAAIDEISLRLDNATGELGGFLADLQVEATTACNALDAGIASIEARIKKEAEALEQRLKSEFARHFDKQNIDDALADINLLRKLVDDASTDFASARRQAAQVRAQYDAYADRVFEEAGKVGKGGLAAAPNNLLRLYAAAASAPALPNLDYARERLAYYYDTLNSVIDTTPAEAYFARLGSELKAMGITLPFNKFDSKMVLADPSSLDIGKVLNKWCGMDLRKMFQGSKLPKSARDAIRLTHDFDKKAFRAWVQIDIDLPLPGRRSLFTIGPFKLDFVNSRLRGYVRLEASKDTDKVEQTGHASMVTTVDAVVSGQSMVKLEKLTMQFDRKGHLDVELDPANIKLNPAFKFIQETLGQIFPDEAGGLKFIKKAGIPIGVEHEFAIPPISIMGGTSGISNLAISNRFALLAYPDFVLANRFALSKPDTPFLFTIFVIGGSGYIIVDAQYRPFNGDLAVTVEAAAGGSAAFGFSLGPVSGSVSVSLSVALSYRKLIGKSRGGGLTVSMVLVIAGSVDVAGLAHVRMTLYLRMNYRNNGQIDGMGTLSVSFRVSRWYKYRYRKNVTKRLRKGRGSGGGNKVLELSAATQASPAPNARARQRARAIMQARRR